jgi:hypothetical protein
MKKLVCYATLNLSLVSVAVSLRIISEMIRSLDPRLSLVLLLLSTGSWLVVLVISLIQLVRVFTKL